MTHHDCYPCPICQVGRLHLRLVTYVNLYDRTLVSVPNTPAWECDFCHTVEYDSESLQRIEALVGQAGPPPNRHRARPKQSLRSKHRAYPVES
jgi:YgiT-type zinc finger domain-containing protein